MNNIYNLIFTFLDDALELIKVLFPNIQALATAATVLIIIIRIYKKWKKQKGTNELGEIHSMVLYLYKKEGGSWPVDSKNYTAAGLEVSSKRWHRTIAHHVALCMKRMDIRGFIKRRMNMGTVKQVNLVPMIVAILGAIKLVIQAFGYDVINDEQINAIANGVASIVAVVGVLLSNRKKGVTIGDRADYSKGADASDKHTV